MIRKLSTWISIDVCENAPFLLDSLRNASKEMILRYCLSAAGRSDLNRYGLSPSFLNLSRASVDFSVFACYLFQFMHIFYTSMNVGQLFNKSHKLQP
jgi:hypothetical protein